LSPGTSRQRCCRQSNDGSRNNNNLQSASKYNTTPLADISTPHWRWSRVTKGARDGIATGEAELDDQLADVMIDQVPLVSTLRARSADERRALMRHCAGTRTSSMLLAIGTYDRSQISKTEISKTLFGSFQFKKSPLRNYSSIGDECTNRRARELGKAGDLFVRLRGQAPHCMELDARVPANLAVGIARPSAFKPIVQ
jgi:hypothetical protein